MAAVGTRWHGGASLFLGMAMMTRPFRLRHAHHGLCMRRAHNPSGARRVGLVYRHDGRADRRPWRSCGLVRAVAPRRVVCAACRRLAPGRAAERDREAGTIEASVMMWARSKASTAWWASP